MSELIANFDRHINMPVARGFSNAEFSMPHRGAGQPLPVLPAVDANVLLINGILIKEELSKRTFNRHDYLIVAHSAFPIFDANIFNPVAAL